MKKTIYLWITLTILLFSGSDLWAQKRGPKHKDKSNKEQGPPPWAPAHGYRAKHEVRYIYFPEHNIYYDQKSGVYISLRGKNWEVSAEIPLALNSEKLRVSTQIALDLSFDTDKPQQDNDRHKKLYSKE